MSYKLRKLIGPSKYVVIQIKDIRVNATFNPVDPKTYCLAIKEFNKMGYSVIFAGRESMPDIFKKLNVINYSQSSEANSKNDHDLIIHSSFVIASASGFCCIADCNDIPLLSLNNWQVNGYFGRKTIQIPAILNINGKKISFADQINYVYKQEQITPKTPTPSGWEVFDATAEDILAGSFEMINLIELNFTKPLTHMQEAYKTLFPLDVPSRVMSRISQTFLERHFDRL
jgi:putative glycosyltransferase (TIGR04372 family)